MLLKQLKEVFVSIIIGPAFHHDVTVEVRGEYDSYFTFGPICAMASCELPFPFPTIAGKLNTSGRSDCASPDEAPELEDSRQSKLSWKPHWLVVLRWLRQPKGEPKV